MKMLITILATLFSLTAAAQYYGPWVTFVENGKYGLKNSDDKMILEPRYDYISCKTRYDGYNTKVLVRMADSCFLVNTETKESSPFVDQPITPKVKLYPAIIAPGDKYGYVNDKGMVVIDGRWDFADYFDNGIARVVDYNGKPFKDDPIYFPTPGRTGFIDTVGNYIIEMEYSCISYFAGGVARFTRGNYIDDDKYDRYNPYRGGKWGLMDDNGKIVLADDTYDFIDHPYFDNRSGKILFAVEQGENVGLIDTDGRVVVPLYKGDMYNLWIKYIFDIKDSSTIKFDVNGFDLDMTNPTKEQIVEKLGQPLKYEIDTLEGSQYFDYENSSFQFNDCYITYFSIKDAQFKLFDGKLGVGSLVSVIKSIPGCRVVMEPNEIYDGVSYVRLWLGGSETPEIDIGHKDGVVVSISYSTPI